MIAEDWRLFYFKLFQAALDELERMVAKLAKEGPTRVRVTSEDAAADIRLQSSHTRSSADPDHPDFRRAKHSVWNTRTGAA